MAEAAHEYHTGEQDISEQVSTYHLVGGLLKWGSLAVAILVSMATLWFCTKAGFLPGAITGFLLLVLGIVFLRSKPDSGH